MFGKDDDSVVRNTPDAGIIPRTMHDILHIIHLRKHLIDARIYVSYVEIFGENVIDLLRGGVHVGHSKVAASRYVLSGAAEKEIKTTSDVMSLMSQGEKMKRKAATAMNERSSRAHALLIIKICQRNTITDVNLTSSLFLVDLGGSEQVVSLLSLFITLKIIAIMFVIFVTI
jgi:kinesin family protein 5